MLLGRNSKEHHILFKMTNLKNECRKPLGRTIFLLDETFFTSRSQTCTSLLTTFVSGRLAWAGLFKNGKSYGASWRGCVGGGFLYGSVGPNGLFTGNKNAYIYPGKE